MIWGDRLGNDDIIVKYVPARLLEDDGSVSGAGFLPRPSDTDGSSIHLLYFYDPNEERSLAEIRRRYRIRTNASGRLASARAGAIRSAADAARVRERVDVIHAPLAAEGRFVEDPAHCLITGLPLPGVMDELIALHFDGLILKTYSTRD